MSITRSITRPITRPLSRPLTAGGAGGGFVDIVSNGVLAPFVTFTRASTATYFDSAGVMQTAAVNEPRVDYDPVTLELRGLLVEAQRTNLLLRSQEFDNSTQWKSQSAAVTPNAAVAPDGSTTADLVTATATSYVFVRQIVSVTPGATYTLSFWLDTSLSSAGNAIRVYNMTTPGDIVAGQACVYGGGWRRQTCTFTVPADCTSIAVYIVSRNATAGEAFYVWGAQLEAGTFATSYIPTAGTTQTRAVDDPDFTIPTGIVRLEYTYDDDTTADVAVTPGAAYQIPTGQKRIKHLRGYRS